MGNPAAGTRIAPSLYTWSASWCGLSTARSATVGPAPAVERLLPELDAHGEYIATELRRRTHALVMSGRLSVKERDE